MNDLKKQARTAGSLYLLSCVAAPFSLLYVPNALIVRGDATATADRMRDSEMLLRLGIAGELWNAVVGIFAILALYRLFKGVSTNLSIAMTVLYFIAVPISLVNLLNYVAALAFVSGPNYLSSWAPSQRDALSYFFMRLHGQGLFIAQIFWGLWLFPFGVAVMRSGFIPRVLGPIVMIAGVGYVLLSMTALLMPAWLPRMSPLLALGAGEIPVFLYLVIWGARTKRDAADTYVPTSPHASPARG